MVRARENAFASCPSATGPMGCGDFPDGAHRCGSPREHDGAHACTCKREWVCQLIPVKTGTAPAVVFIPDQPDEGAFARGVKTALDEIHRKGRRR